MPKQVTNVAADDALTTIYRISHDEREEVIAARVAQRLGIRPASVAGMLSRLSRDRLVTGDGQKNIPELLGKEDLGFFHRLEGASADMRGNQKILMTAGILDQGV